MEVEADRGARATGRVPGRVLRGQARTARRSARRGLPGRHLPDVRAPRRAVRLRRVAHPARPKQAAESAEPLLPSGLAARAAFPATTSSRECEGCGGRRNGRLPRPQGEIGIERAMEQAHYGWRSGSTLLWVGGLPSARGSPPRRTPALRGRACRGAASRSGSARSAGSSRRWSWGGRRSRSRSPAPAIAVRRKHRYRVGLPTRGHSRATSAYRCTISTTAPAFRACISRATRSETKMR